MVGTHCFTANTFKQKRCEVVPYSTSSCCAANNGEVHDTQTTGDAGVRRGVLRNSL